MLASQNLFLSPYLLFKDVQKLSAPNSAVIEKLPSDSQQRTANPNCTAKYQVKCYRVQKVSQDPALHISRKVGKETSGPHLYPAVH